jgi:hypothetical protein
MGTCCIRSLRAARHACAASRTLCDDLGNPASLIPETARESAPVSAGDRRTAEDSLAFLLRWLERFPRYRSNPFWLSGALLAAGGASRSAAALCIGGGRPAATVWPPSVCFVYWAPWCIPWTLLPVQARATPVTMSPTLPPKS